MVICGDALKVLQAMEAESIDCVVTSPPYWALRDYGVVGQLGLEPTFQEYITKLCGILDEVKRVLKKTGTCWVNLGDTYFAHNGSRGNKTDAGADSLRKKSNDERVAPRFKAINNYQSKCLLQIPARFSIEMCNRGWILRNTIIWWKPNCMPSSVKDRFTVDYEYVFFFVKEKKYWFETQYEAYTEPMNRWGGDVLKADGESTWDKGTGQETYRNRNMRPNELGRNKRSVWRITTKPFKEAHFAVFPEELVETPIKAGCPKGGVVLDPFCGSGTTGVVAKKLGRHFIGIDLNKDYCKMADTRIDSVLL